MKAIKDHQVIVHGVEHAQHFQGCGISGTKYTDAATGIGTDAMEAFEDALEQLAMNDWGVDDDTLDTWNDKPDAEEAQLPDGAHDELWVYVSVLVS